MSKQLLSFTPQFTPGVGGAGVLDFSGYYGGFAFTKLYAVINITRNEPIYIAGAPGLGATQGLNPAQITLAYNTSTHAATDELNIYYDTAPGFENNNPVENNGQLQKMQESINQILVELKVLNLILAQGLNINRDDIDGLRQDVNNPMNAISTSI